MCRVEKAQLAHDVLTYMLDHQDAQDTLEGIVEWWLVEQEIKHQIVAVQEVLADLVEKDLVIQHHGRDSRVHYSINRNRKNEIMELLAKLDKQTPLSPK